MGEKKMNSSSFPAFSFQPSLTSGWRPGRQACRAAPPPPPVHTVVVQFSCSPRPLGEGGWAVRYITVEGTIDPLVHTVVVQFLRSPRPLGEGPGVA